MLSPFINKTDVVVLKSAETLRSAEVYPRDNLVNDDLESITPELQMGADQESPGNVVARYKRRWGIPKECSLLGGADTSVAATNSPLNWNTAPPLARSIIGANTMMNANRQPAVSQPTSINASQASSAAPHLMGTNGTMSGSQQQPNASYLPPQQMPSANAWPQVATTNSVQANVEVPGAAPSAGNVEGTNAETDGGSTDNVSGSGQSSSAKTHLEQLNTMRDALYSQDGWGGQNVNQDSAWDVPPSPEPAVSKDGTTPAPPTVRWKLNVNNGTDLWEANLRNGGQPPPAPIPKVPWGHTPSTNIGGTWGEDDDVGESSNVWTGGGASSNMPNSSAQQWGSQNSNGPLWGEKKGGEWGGGNSWNDPREGMSRIPNGMDHRVMDPSHMRMDHRGGMNDNMMRGRMNGSGDQMWGGPQPPLPHHVGPGGPPPNTKMMPPLGPGGAVPNKVPHWKDMSGGIPGNNMMGRGAMPGPPNMPQNRMGPGGMKPDPPIWNQPGRNGAWNEGVGQDMQNMQWGDDNKLNNWNDPSVAWGMQKPKNPGSWPDENDWNHPSKTALTKEILWASKQFRILAEMNFKKEDIENALRASNMVLEDALDYLNMSRNNAGMDGWRRPDEQNMFDHNNHNAAFGANRFNQQQQLPFNLPAGGGANMINNALNPAMMQKMNTQQPPPQASLNQQPFINARANPTGPANNVQLNVLIQRIQMAVATGYLNHKILNQPLSPQTLILLNNLIAYVKTIQGLQAQLAAMPNQKIPAAIQLQLQLANYKQLANNVQQDIEVSQALYLKQNPQQAMLHQQQQQLQQQQLLMAGTRPVMGGAGGNAFFKNQNDMSLIQSNFADLSIKEPQMTNNYPNQSRLSRWKMPSMEKEDEFGRPKGQEATSPNMSLLTTTGERDEWSNQNQDESKDWSSVVSGTFNDMVPEFEPGKPWKGNQMKTVEEDPSITPGSVVRSPLLNSDVFGTSTVEKSSPSAEMEMPPLTLAISSSTWNFNTASTSSFTSPIGSKSSNSGGKSSWGDGQSGSGELWGGMSKNRAPPTMQMQQQQSRMQLSSGGTSVTGSGWNNGPIGSGGNGLASPRWTPAPNTPWGGTGSTWLLLKNLAPQMDSATLKTLCVQHGPLQAFHVYLNQGVIFVKYNSKEEATRAMNTLNNCTLGNTTIYVDAIGEAEVNNYLQQLNQQQANNNVSAGWNNRTVAGQGSSKPPTPDTWATSSSSSNQLWTNSSPGLWSNAGPPAEGSEQRANQSNLNSFLPGDLLGGESM